MKKLLLAGFVVVVAAAGLTWWLLFEPVNKVERAVKDTLNDPASAVFKQVAFFKKTGAGCGYVNAKNKMGGYVGFASFILFPDGEVRFEPVEEMESSDPAEKIKVLERRIQQLENWLTLVRANCPGFEK